MLERMTSNDFIGSYLRPFAARPVWARDRPFLMQLSCRRSGKMPADYAPGKALLARLISRRITK